jgi:putative colanic acid biosynthesis acetyltransferase WcaF
MLDVAENRKARKYSRGDLARRVLWGCAAPLFRWSPRPCFGWRAFLLRLFGAKIGRHVHIHRTVTIWIPWNLEVGDYAAIGDHAFIYNLGPIAIEERATISHRAHLCAGTHDYTKADFPLLKPPIRIRGQAWVCADAFIGPGVTVGAGAIVAARAVAVKDVAPWTIVGGNPAKWIKERVPSDATKG